MDEQTKLIRILINGQSSMKSELLSEIKRVEVNLIKRFENLEKRVDKLEINLTKRLDMIGLSEARLEDDAPTIDEFDNLERRVSKLEKAFAS